jgi:PAS domain S-box-containing protein
MKKEPSEMNPGNDLRRLAEERLKDSRSNLDSSAGEESRDALALVHELQVHQIELEMQNEELKRTKLVAEDALAKYSDLYDFAPVGLFDLNEQGIILEVNLAGATLLGVERRNLSKRNFLKFVVSKDRASFDDFRKKTFETPAKQTCELSLLRDGKPIIYVRIEGTADVESPPNERVCHIAVVDITDTKKAGSLP